jgi:phage baseplate assembly protein W
MSRPFLGTGLGFPLGLNADGQLQTAAEEESIRQSILIILGTAKGERLMRPDFGCGVYDLVFEAQTPATAGNIAQAVQEALLTLEPRIDVLDVEVTPESNPAGETLLVNVQYQVRSSNNIFNLVYPFYLERSPG